MRLPLHEYILALVEIVALAALITRLLVSGLARLYKCLLCYVSIDLLDTVWPFLIPSRSKLYGYVYFAFQCIKLCFYALIVFELYSVLFRDLRGIAKLARRYTVLALAISILLSLLLRTALPHPHHPLVQLFYFEIPIISSLVLFMLLITVFLAYYPVPLHRNALLYAAGYAVYFFSKTTLLFLINLRLSTLLRAASTALLIVDLACIALWAIFLNHAGERRTLALGGRWSPPERRQQVLLRLRALNDSVLRARPK
jgi:hypothetical protein